MNRCCGDADCGQVDEMKKRAIHTAGSYDEFKNLVACATQKPIESGALVAFGDAKVTRNAVARAGSGAPATATATATAGLSKDSLASVPVPKLMHEFSRDWRRHCKNPVVRYQYVARIEPPRLARLFSGELDTTLLAEIVDCFATALTTPLPPLAEPAAVVGSASSSSDPSSSAGTAAVEGGASGDAAAAVTGSIRPVRTVVLAALQAFSTAARFDLTIDLLSKGEKAQIAELFRALREAGGGDSDSVGDVAALAAKYKC